MLRNITLSAQEQLIEAARAKAQAENRSLNDAFRDWLAVYAGHRDPVARYNELMERADKVSSTGAAYQRDEANGR